VLRPASPLDLASLLALQARACPNQARSRDALAGRRALPYAALMRDWGPGRRARRAWMLSRRGLAAGVVVVRRHMGETCWEVVRLQAARGDADALADLLDGAAQAVAELGAHKLFLRAEADSSVAQVAREALFAPSFQESVYVLRSGGTRSAAPASDLVPADGAAIRPATAADEHALYRLYQAVVPAPAREAEGVTLAQWRDSLDLPRRWRWDESLVLERNGAIAGWAARWRCHGSAVLNVLASPECATGLGALVAAALHGLPPGAMGSCLLPGYLQALASALTGQSFQKAGEHIVHVRHVTARVRQPEVVAVGAVSR
jgi:hypothetical protein